MTTDMTGHDVQLNLTTPDILPAPTRSKVASVSQHSPDKDELDSFNLGCMSLILSGACACIKLHTSIGLRSML